jgi:BON domain
MKLSIVTIVCVATITSACSHESRPPSTQTPSTLPTQTALVATSPTSESGTPSIPAHPPDVPAPVAPPARAPEEVPLTASSGIAAPQALAANPPPADPALERTESPEDQESVAEIRALLASDSSLSPSARRVMIVARKGRIWLRGQVNTAAERAAIERAARKAANVRDVRNELSVLE